MKTIQELKDANIPSVAFDMLFSQDDPSDPVQQLTKVNIERYLAGFVQSKDCICCGTTQAGLFGAFFGGFQLGIVHGEGECGTCGYPARILHEIKDADGKIIFSVTNFLLQYHPSVLELKDRGVTDDTKVC
jgi:hypothetical protein